MEVFFLGVGLTTTTIWHRSCRSWRKRQGGGQRKRGGCRRRRRGRRYRETSDWHPPSLLQSTLRLPQPLPHRTGTPDFLLCPVLGTLSWPSMDVFLKPSSKPGTYHRDTRAPCGGRASGCLPSHSVAPAAVQSRGPQAQGLVGVLVGPSCHCPVWPWFLPHFLFLTFPTWMKDLLSLFLLRFNKEKISLSLSLSLSHTHTSLRQYLMLVRMWTNGNAYTLLLRA